jgi:hypothetical protein
MELVLLEAPVVLAGVVVMAMLVAAQEVLGTKVDTHLLRGMLAAQAVVARHSGVDLVVALGK